LQRIPPAAARRHPLRRVITRPRPTAAGPTWKDQTRLEQPRLLPCPPRHAISFALCSARSLSRLCEEATMARGSKVFRPARRATHRATQSWERQRKRYNRRLRDHAGLKNDDYFASMARHANVTAGSRTCGFGAPQPDGRGRAYRAGLKRPEQACCSAPGETTGETDAERHKAAVRALASLNAHR